jgi:FAD/FMN-containing dehydrogenase
VGLPATIEEVQQAVLLKKNYLHYPRSPLKIELMRHIKKALDPNSDLNLGKLFD